MLRLVQRTAPGEDRAKGLPPWLSELLAFRGVDTDEKARQFLNPTLDQLHDPFLMPGMGAAASLIREALKERAPIAVYGDYDADGVCAAAMMVEGLRELGGTADYYIPSRHEEGYGLNEQAVRRLARDCRLLITVDCGIASLREAALAGELGMQVIITDHHQVGQALPQAQAVLNPLLGDYPFRHLCGAGVAFKLLTALGGMEMAQEYLELAALATVADLVPLTGENRVIASLGLGAMARTKRPGLRALMEAAGVHPGESVSAGQAGFGLAPRLNAGGRLKSATLGAELLLTKDPDRARGLAQDLDRENTLRQKLEAEIFQQALSQVERETDFLSDRALVAMGEGWNSGVIGLAAGRLTQRFHYPSVVLSQEGAVCVGSARSIPGVNLYRMLDACRDLFLRFGGHEQAAGLTIPVENVPAFKQRLSQVIRESCDPEVFIPVREYDMALPLSQVTKELAQALEALQPAGMGNPEPVFLLEDAQVQDMRPVGREGAHLKCVLAQGGQVRDGIAFGMGPMARSMPPKVQVLFSPERSAWNGSVTVQCGVKAILPAPDIYPREEEALEAILQEIRHLAANDRKIHPPAEASDPGLLEDALEGAQGTLILARTLSTARRIGSVYEQRLDRAAGRVADRRAFHTLLFPGRIAQLQDIWRTVVLADGELLPGEAALIRELCPRARVMVFPENGELRAFLQPLAMTDEALREFYRALRAQPGAHLHRLAEAAGLTMVQAKAGLYVFSELSLLDWEEEPFSIRLHPPRKCALTDSPLLSALRAAADQQGKEAGHERVHDLRVHVPGPDRGQGSEVLPG